MSPPVPPVTVFSPTPAGGHPEYVHDLMTAMAQEAPDRPLRLVSSRRLAGRFRSSAYSVDAVLPILTGLRGSAGVGTWVGDRALPGRRPESAFLRQMLDRPTEVVHLQEYNSLLMPRHVRKLKAAGHLVAVTVHNIDPHEGRAGRPLWLYRWWQARAWRRADVLFVHTEANAATLRRRLGRGHARIHVTPHGIWSTAGGPVSTTPHEGSLLLFGVLRQNKGIEVLLEALTLLPTNVRLTIAGDVPDPRYEKRVAELIGGLPRAVQWRRGFVEPADLEDVFASAAIVVLPYTQFEAQSGVLHLALAYGRPVVVSDVGGMAETVSRFDCGEIVPPGDAAALAEGIQRLLVPARLAQAASGSAAARDQLSWRATARGVWEAYDLAVGSRPVS